MIIWGGQLTGYLLASGARYNPSSDEWRPVSSAGAPAARYLHSAVWTGTEMVVFGGVTESLDSRAEVGRYNPLTDSWTVTSHPGTAAAVVGGRALWTGSKILVYGSCNICTPAGPTGGIYDPAQDSWTSMSLAGKPLNGVVAWTGREMIVYNAGTPTTSALFDPNLNRWRRMIDATFAMPVSGAEAVWTGTEFIVLGGVNRAGEGESTGGHYTPMSFYRKD